MSKSPIDRILQESILEQFAKEILKDEKETKNFEAVNQSGAKKGEYNRKHILTTRSWDTNVELVDTLVKKIDSLEKQEKESQFKIESLIKHNEEAAKRVSDLTKLVKTNSNEIEKLKKQETENQLKIESLTKLVKMHPDKIEEPTNQQSWHFKLIDAVIANKFFFISVLFLITIIITIVYLIIRNL